MLQSFLGVLVGFVPALLLLFYILDRYKGCFEERKVFFAFFIGIILGFVIAVIEFIGNTLGFLDLGSEYLDFVIASIISIALIQECGKVLALRLKKLRGKLGITFNGLSLGLGFSAMYIFSYILASLKDLTDYQTILWATVLGLGLLLLHGSLGTLIGYGYSIRKTTNYLSFAIFLHIILNVAIFFRLRFIISQEALALFAIFYGLVLLFYILTSTLPKSLPEELRKRRRRLLRKGFISP